MWRALSAVIAVLLSSGLASAGSWGTPTLLYCTMLNDQPAVSASFARMENGHAFSGVYYDPTQGASVPLPGIGTFFGNEFATLSGGFQGLTVDNRAEMSADPLALRATIVNEAWAAPGYYGFVNTSSSAWTWYVLRGARGPVSLRADVVFQGAVSGDATPQGGEASAFFTHVVNVRSYSTDKIVKTVIGINGRAQPPGVPCGPWDVHGTVPDQCFDSDGQWHPVSYVIRSNPFVVLPDVPFQLTLGLNAAASVSSSGPDPVWASSRFDDPGLARSTSFPGVAGLAPEGFVVDQDGDPATRDVAMLSDLGYTIQPLPDPAIFVGVTETAYTSSTSTETVVARTGQFSAPVTGAFDGSIDISPLTLASIATGPWSGKGFFSGNWQAVLGGLSYRGSLRGFSYESAADQRVYLKGVVSGSVNAMAEGYLTESVPGSGVYDRISMEWKLSDVAGAPSAGRLDMSGAIALQNSQTYRSTRLLSGQLTASGTTRPQENGPLDVVVTSVRVASAPHPLAGQGFALISYQSPAGPGEGWTHAGVALPGVVALGGMASGPLAGIVQVVLDESLSPKAVRGYVRRTDLGLPPMADLEVDAWTWNGMSPGQTFAYSITYVNRGLQPAADVVVLDRLPTQVEFVSATGGGVYDPESHMVTFNVGTVPPGGRGYLSLTARVRWGLSWSEPITNQVFIGTGSAEVDATVSPDSTALTPEWWALQIAYGDDWDARLTPPGFDPNNPDWRGLAPDSLRRRVEQALANIKQRDPAAGEYLQSLYDQGKIHIDLDLSSSEWNGAVGHLYVSGQDLGWTRDPILQISDARWNAEAYSDARLPNLEGKIVHERRHSDGQTFPGSQKGEMQAFSAEGTYHLRIIDSLVRQRRYDDAQALLRHMYDRWTDLALRNNNWYDAFDLSLKMRTRITEISQLLGAGKYQEALAKIAQYQTDLAGISQGPSEPVHNGSQQASWFTTAWDPNAKYGPEGPVARGQRLDYRVEYENVGQGEAFGVYVTDELPAALDDTTLSIGPVRSKKDGSIVAPAGSYSAATRTITWTVGEVGPGAGGYAEVGVDVRADAADGTEIVNYATIHFPSVPQVTRTNPVVSVVTPPGQPVETTLGPVRVWVGLRNSDDQGTSFDVRAELYADGTLVAEGQALCVPGLTRDPARARPVLIPLDPTDADPDLSGALLSLKVLARIGTTPDGRRCAAGSHSSAVGLRVYYDGLPSRSRIALGLGAGPRDFYLRSLGGAMVLDGSAPTSKTARTADSPAVKFVGGNRWAVAGTWSYLAP